MASRTPRPRRLLLPTLLAAVLVGEITGIALARSIAPSAAPAPSSAAAPLAPTAPAGDRSERRPADSTRLVERARDSVAPVLNAAHTRLAPPSARPAIGQPSNVARSVTSSTTTAPAARSTTASGTNPASSASYQGRNRVWIPFLGINKSVQSFPCSRSRPPDAGMYRWGCAGRNNVYLLSHAWSTFKPLHDAYVRGRLQKGMKVIYADGSGRVGTYSVIWWRVVRPTTAASWAWASLSRPGMTLQTCVGAKSEFRLMVRLTKVG